MEKSMYVPVLPFIHRIFYLPWWKAAARGGGGFWDRSEFMYIGERGTDRVGEEGLFALGCICANPKIHQQATKDDTLLKTPTSNSRITLSHSTFFKLCVRSPSACLLGLGPGQGVQSSHSYVCTIHRRAQTSASSRVVQIWPAMYVQYYFMNSVEQNKCITWRLGLGGAASCSWILRTQSTTYACMYHVHSILLGSVNCPPCAGGFHFPPVWRVSSCIISCYM